jgi:hypothetical protein
MAWSHRFGGVRAVDMSIKRLSLMLGVTLLAVSARAEPTSTDGVRLSFVRKDSAASCISAPALEREITRRMGRDPFSGSARQWIEGVIERQSDFFEVQLFERDADGNVLGNRRLREQVQDCHKLDDAIVLAIALIIDPTAHLAPASTDTSATAPAASTAMAGSPGVVDTSTHASPALRNAQSLGVATATPASRDTAAPAIRESAAPTNNPSSKRPAAFVTADAVVLSGVLPGAAPGVELVTRLPLDALSLSSLRFSALYLPEKQSNVAGKLGYSLTAMEAGACLGHSGNQFVWFGCTAFGMGAVHVVVRNPDPFEPGDRLWAAIRLEAGVAVRVVGPLWLEARLFDLVAPRRWEFRVRSDGRPDVTTTAFAQQIFMPGAALGLGLRFD